MLRLSHARSVSSRWKAKLTITKKKKIKNGEWQEPAQPRTLTQGGHEIASLLN